MNAKTPTRLNGTRLFLAITAMGSLVWGGDQTYRSTGLFDAEPGGQTSLIENFDSLANGQTASDFHSGFVVASSGSGTAPSSFWGGWGCPAFVKGALIPEPRFRSDDLVLDFAVSVFGVGAQVFDDFDGSPRIADITLTAFTESGAMLVISETRAGTGCDGFLGATSDDGITRVVFSISNTGGNLEVDFLHLRSFRTLEGSVDSISAAAGGEQRLYLLAGNANAGFAYATLGTTSGTSPGFSAFGVNIPLNYDAYTNRLLTHLNQAPLFSSFGTLDSRGTAVSRFAVPVGTSPSLVDTVFHHASVVLESGPIGIRQVSNPVALTLAP